MAAKNVYETKSMDDVSIEPSSGLKIVRGYHYIFKNLTITKDSVLNVTDGGDWWNAINKWTIIEVKKDFTFEGKIQVKHWKTPFIPSLQVSEIVEIHKHAYVLSHLYQFGVGGKGGNAGHGGNGVQDQFAHPLAQTIGSVGTLNFGGGGGGGYGFTDAFISGQQQQFCARGNDANGYQGGKGCLGHTANGGNGGNGGLTPMNGVGGLLVIIYHCNLICNTGVIDIQGMQGTAGENGGNSTPAGIVGGGGAGGAGSPGLPGGKVYLISDNPAANIKVILEKVKGGTGGSRGAGYVLQQTAESGTDGAEGLAGQCEKIEIQ